MGKTFTRQKLADLVGIPPRRLDFYISQKLISISEDEKNPGRGVARQLSEKNAFELAIVKKLSDAGLSLTQIKSMLKFFTCIQGSNSPLFDGDSIRRKGGHRLSVGNHRLFMIAYDGGTDGGYFIGPADDRGLPKSSMIDFRGKRVLLLADLTDIFKKIADF
jgi:hypothetical protein